MHKLRHAQAGEVLLIDASVLIATSLIFFFVPNLWLLIPVHWLLGMVSRRLVARGREWTVDDGRSGDVVYQIRQ